MSEKETYELSPRELRHRRRVRNQICVYIASILIVGIFVGGIAAGVLKVSHVMRDRKQAAQDTLAAVEENVEEQEPEEVVISEPEPVVEEPVEERDALDDIVDACIDAMPLEDKVAGLFLITPEQLTGVTTAIKAGDATQEALNQYAVGGLVYRSGNIKSQDQFAKMVTTTATMSRYPLFLAVKETGATGTIAKSAISTEELGTFAEMVAGGDPTVAYSAGQTIGEYMSALGLNVNLAPSADLVEEKDSFGTDATNAGPFVSMFVNGLQEKAVSACLSMFPGGAVTDGGDTDQGMAVIEGDLETLRQERFSTFLAGIEAGANFCMISNASAPMVTGDNTPCVLSPAVVTDVLREELGFKGIIITDDFTDAAITSYYTSGEAAVKAIRAGADMIYMPESFEEAYQGVIEAVNTGALMEERIDESLHRIYRVKYADRVPEEQN